MAQCCEAVLSYAILSGQIFDLTDSENLSDARIERKNCIFLKQKYMW